MSIYIIINICMLLISLYSISINKDGNKGIHLGIVYLCIITFLIFFAGLRECGFDYELYYDRCGAIFTSDNWLETSILDGIEPGFGFFSWIFTWRVLLLVVASLSLGLVGYFFYKYSPYPYISLYLYLPNLYMIVMGQMRQGLAMSIILFAFIEIEKKKKFIKLILLASMFHITAIGSLILIIIPKLNKVKKIKFYLITIIIVYFFNIYGNTFFMHLIPLFPAFISTKLYFYANIYDLAYQDANIGFDSATILRIFILSLAYYIIKQGKEVGHNVIIIFNIYFIGTCIYIGLGFLPTLSTRFSYTFTILDIMLLPMLLLLARQKYKILITLLILFLVFNRQLPFLSEKSKYYEEYVPYKFDKLF